MQLFIRQSGKVHGPVDPSKLKKLVEAGKLKPSAEVAKDKIGPWKPIKNVKGLKWPNELIAAKAKPPSKQLPTSPPESPDATPPVQPIQVVVQSPVHPQLVKQPHKEEVVWAGSPSQMNNLKTYIICALFFWLIIPVFYALWRFLVVKSIKYEVTNQRIKFSSGVISKSVQELELFRVKDTSLNQSVAQRLTGLATITLLTSDRSGKTAVIEGIGSKIGHGLREEIRSLTVEARERKGVRELDMA